MPDDEITLDLSQGLPKRPRISEHLKRIRLKQYRQWISDDLAEFMAERMPLRGRNETNRGLKALRRMKQRVLEYMRRNPGVSKQDAIDEVSTQLIRDVEAGRERDYYVAEIVSPSHR